MNPYNYCIYLLSKREYTSYTLSQKLIKRYNDMTDNDIQILLKRLTDDKYLSDNRAMDMYKRYYSGLGKSKREIGMKLKSKGLEYDSNDIDDIKQLQIQYTKHYKEGMDMNKWIQKMMRKGFKYSDCKRVIDDNKSDNDR